MPDADSVASAGSDVLLRADNLVPDKEGALDLRRGSSKLYSSLDGGADDSIHSLHTVELANGTTYRVKGVGDRVYINGTSQGTFTGSGDTAIGDDAYQIFIARGTTKKKWDGTNWNNWGITAPINAPTLAAVNSVTTTVAAFNNSESPATTIPEGSGAVGGETDAAGAANQATKLTPDGSTYRGVIQRLFSSDQDFFTIAGVEGTETDLFDIYLKFDNPRDVETIQVIFGIDDSSTAPFTTDRFEFTFDMRGKKEIPIKDFESEGYSAYSQSVLSSLAQVRPQDVTGIRTPEQVKQILQGVGKIPSPTSAPPSDSGVWGHLTITRGQFKRVGSTATRGWDTVRGFKIIYTTVRGKTAAVTFADAIFVGGGARTLTGTYRCVIRAVRNFSQYYELSPPSAQSEPLNLNHQTLQVTIGATTLASLDSQVDQLWVYLFGGWLDTYYRFVIVPSTVRGGMTVDELAPPAGSNLDSADERSRITSWGYTMNVDDASGDLILQILTSEMDALTENERLEPYQMLPPDNIVGIAGPWKGRMFTLTSEGYVYPSTRRSPSSFNSIQVIDLTRYGNPLWIVRTGQGVYVGMEKDVVFLQGTGDDSEDGALIDLFPQPLNIGNPPIDSCRWVDGNAITYRSADGLMLLTGSNLTPIPMNGTSLLWRGMDRHGVSGLNTSTGRFRCAIDDLMLYVLAPEGSETSGNVIYRYSTASQQWSRLTYDEVDDFKSIFKEPTGTLTAGDSQGNLWQLDTGNTDNGEDILVTLLTPITDGGQPFARKDSFDFQIHGYTAGRDATAELFREGSGTATSTYTFAIDTAGAVYRFNAADFGTFLKGQLRITGRFNSFTLNGYNLTYRVRPQHSFYLDTGYINPSEPGDMTWIYEVEFDANAAEDVTMKLYINDVLKVTSSVAVTAGVRKPYFIPIPRGTKGYRPRVVFQTDSANSQGAGGFECYNVRVRMSTSGNQEGAEYKVVYPVAPAP